ncbi:hypothetical protein AX17_002618 [Amanita inopinata Kibby_2008]|nr:hypothetical protein AX17_002618 [Amanita inopinata Kibby_2008]
MSYFVHSVSPPTWRSLKVLDLSLKVCATLFLAWDAILIATWDCKVGEFLKSLLLPTSSARFQSIDEKINNCYLNDIAAIERNRDTLRHLLLASRAKRMETLEKLRKTLPPNLSLTNHGTVLTTTDVVDDSTCPKKRVSTLNSKVESLAGAQEGLTEIYLNHVKNTRRLRKHLVEVEEDLDMFKFTVRTQAVVELTHYRGIRDWGEMMHSQLNNYSVALATLSIAGAGLVYSTIFGGTRGDIGLMSFTFPLFTVGFLIPGFLSVSMTWASHLPKELTFASQRFWTVVIVFALAVATNMVIAAIIIVNITIFFLDPNDRTIHRASRVGQTFTISGIVSLAFSGAVVVLAVSALFLGLLSRRLRVSLRKYHKDMCERQEEALNRYDHV